SGDRSADDLLAVPGAVDVGGVDEGDAELQRACHGRLGLGILGAAVDAGEAHGAEPDGGDHRSRGPETAMLHMEPPGSRVATPYQASALCPSGRDRHLEAATIARIRACMTRHEVMAVIASETRRPDPTPSRWWQQHFAGRLTEHVFESRVLAGNPLGDPTARPLYVYVPPGYDESEERYPSVYVIQGYTGQA